MSALQFSSGWIEVIGGVMFSGKTEELMRRVRRAMIARKRVQVFKSHLDSRYAGVFSVSSHDGRSVEAVPVDSSSQIAQRIDHCFSFGKEDLARSFVRKQLETKRIIEDLLRRARAAAEAREELRKVAVEQEEKLARIRRRAELLIESGEGGEERHGIAAGRPRAAVTDEEVEAAFIAEKSRRNEGKAA